MFILALLPHFRGELRAADAAPKTPSVWEREYATGDWSGMRTLLADHGVIFNFTYAADPIAFVSGGIKRGALYNGFLDLGTDIDLEKLAG